ncbi:50S ribosomal protein L4 [Blastopirellula retiformator]|uniref:Large ribosomal subunit protein uL4 n=1 Tax=Blastopirellula retiformator TaxID=2527970 RepID=A0A5C5V3K3_9BACT|nr:50S ribosomal protein L4 [Blastopirellula retiformator]TWT33146.1 50S ribosomal protein L4 [Blastopirellula retiformator]
MPSLPIFDTAGKEVGKYDIESTDIAPRISKQLLHDAVVMYQANLRQGTHRSKTRGEVAGSTKKMYRQKGTGNARAGHKRSGVRRGGGHIHAKRPRDYSYRLNRKALQLATRMAFASKIQSGSVVVLNEFALSEVKTKQVADTLKALKVYGGSTLITIPALDEKVYKSARNIEKVTVSPVSELNALKILTPKRLVITKSALDAIKEKAAQAKAAKA